MRARCDSRAAAAGWQEDARGKRTVASLLFRTAFAFHYSLGSNQRVYGEESDCGTPI